MTEHGLLRLELRMAHDAALKARTREARAAAGLVEDIVAEELRLLEPRPEQEWR